MVLESFDLMTILAVVFIIELMFFVLYRSYKAEKEYRTREKTQQEEWTQVLGLLEQRTKEQRQLILNLKQDLGVEDMISEKKRVHEENEAFDKQMGYNLDMAYGSTPLILTDKEE